MTLTKGRIDRTGEIKFHDASLAVWEDGLNLSMTSDQRTAWKRQFKRDVFARIVQTLNRLGWTCIIPPDLIDRYGISFACDYRYCTKGDLQAELSLSGRCIEFKMWQDVQNVEHPSGGKYEFDKTDRMTYLQRLEMERTRRRVRDYLCNVFTGYTFEPPKPGVGPDGLTALEYIEADWRACWHYKPEIGRRGGEESSYNNKSADGGTVRHGERVWFADWHGRILTGTAYYHINNMWWVITGKYGRHNVASFEIYTRQPENLRIKRNGQQRRKRLEAELAKAVEAMNYERAGVLRDILFPQNPALFLVWHDEHKAYHRSCFQGYTTNPNQAGKFTADEIKGWDRAPNKIIALGRVEDLS